MKQERMYILQDLESVVCPYLMSGEIQKREQEIPQKSPEKGKYDPQKRKNPGLYLPEIGPILDEIDGILQDQPVRKRYRQPGGQ